LVLLGTVLKSEATLIRDVDDGQVVDQAIVIGAAASSYEAVKATAVEFLKRYRGERAILRLIIASTAEEAARAIGRGRVHGLGYESTVDEVQMKGFPAGPIAQVFGLSDAAVLTFRNGDKIRSEILAGRSDPSVIQIGETVFEILHLRLTKAPSSPPDYSLIVYAKSSPGLSSAGVSNLTRKLERLTNGSTVFVSVRQDVWFMDDFEYPDVLPWAPVQAMPSKLEYARSSQLRCVVNRKRLSCSGSNFEP
jgi:hypothetical protein